ncbi:NAD(P)/FAD-dependent oxidoreductase [Sutcliffiella rhizosphaerae]|uniref:Thioredoxin reductase n=1 Tax=Sutcliffiella rhizosphaerae TaxID=2880967 RepID=A0ABM8YJQ4_9BACI|nr:NAD(P)/FAD-dependent oxidoreductase [Sutcliffiella rhizosphaerae]CAG9620024.1 Thioredoxin reductase [Sutcliffiella rhizosphaerae]
MLYDCMIIGGGIAGLQAAIQLGRYQYKVLVIDDKNGRSNICNCYHNLLGWPEGVSGKTLRLLGEQQAEKLNVQFQQQRVTSITKKDGGFQANTSDSYTFHSKRLLLATGVKDNIPPFPQLFPCLGISVFICPDCDGYESAMKPTLVLGSGNAGANMALALTHWTNLITYINHDNRRIEEEMSKQLAKKEITIVTEPITSLHINEDLFQGVTVASGETLTATTAFLAFGGNKVHTDLAEQLGVKLEHNKHINVDVRTKMTNVENVWAAGDIVAHSEQVTIAMGDGVQAAIWIHKSLLE